ncbi:hypothetical protein NHX12_011355 [Muraenolepis orangiensis]|uniref:Uncharacterized protein n=1 Tax=Muraenolepis orangiensis TaxID=630683 RepID=A0A9Q0I7J8_9TELE|nr:hypothetical protein NHX12_011355 [Muraenolepis orangiensis]
MTVCVGNEFSLPVNSGRPNEFIQPRIVSFTSKSPPGQTHIILEKTLVKDPRFEWTKDQSLVLKEVTLNDAGRYSIGVTAVFSYKTVTLIVSECLHSYRVNYGEDFQHRIPEDGFWLEFSSLGSPPESKPVMLWDRRNPEMSLGGRGQMQLNGQMWVARKVTPVDQGNYTMRSKTGKLMSHTRLTIQGHAFNVTRFTKESVSLPLFLPVHDVMLTFSPAQSPDDPRPRRGPVQLVRDGQVLDNDFHFLNRVSVDVGYGQPSGVIISGLSTKHAGVYYIRDHGGHLVSSTILNVIALVGLFLFRKRYPNCSLSKICCLLGNSPPANPPTINVQDYSPGVHEPSPSYTRIQHPGSPRKPNPIASPAPTVTSRGLKKANSLFGTVKL